MDIVLIQQTTLHPTSIVKDSNTTGAVTDIDESVDSPDGNKLAVVNETANYLVRCQFTPPPNLTRGGGLQRFRAWVMKNAAGGIDPWCQMTLAEAGSSLRGLPGLLATSEVGQLAEGTFDIAEIVNPEDTECRLDGLTSTNRNIDIDAVEWVATHDTSIPSAFAAGDITLSSPSDVLIGGVPQAFAAGNIELRPVIEAGSVSQAFASGGITLSSISGIIELESIPSYFAAGDPTLGVTGEVEVVSIPDGSGSGDPTVEGGEPLISMLSIGHGFVAGAPFIYRLDVQPDLQNRIKPGTWRFQA